MGVRMFEAARRMTLASLPPNLPEPKRNLLFERFYGEPLPTLTRTSADKPSF